MTVRAAGVELVGVTKRFGELEAVSNVDLAIHEGEFVSLLGPSGCGKTTTLRMIGGFEVPDAGDILVLGSSVLGIPPHKRAVGMVFQDYALFPHKTVEQNLAFGLRMQRLAKNDVAERVDGMLGLLRLEELRRRKPDQLSGGQRQRVALGRALVLGRGVLLMDEPLGALDLKLRKRMQLELKQIHRTVGGTFIYVTHDQEEAITMSDRIAVLNAGRVEQFASVVDIYRKPRTRFVADFIGEANSFEGVVESAELPTWVRCAGDLRIRSSVAVETPVAGVHGVVVVRPERVVIGDAVTKLENQFEMEVRDVIFTGPTVRLIGSVGSLALQVATTQDLFGRVSPGDSVKIGWSEQDALLIPATR
jgi:ABC-type Fe3+/spermidine/putrescine transport system ATPase subunit